MAPAWRFHAFVLHGPRVLMVSSPAFGLDRVFLKVTGVLGDDVLFLFELGFHGTHGSSSPSLFEASL